MGVYDTHRRRALLVSWALSPEDIAQSASGRQGVLRDCLARKPFRCATSPIRLSTISSPRLHATLSFAGRRLPLAAARAR